MTYSYGVNIVERDEKRAMHYFELAAIGGDEQAMHYLGAAEGRAGNHSKALKHFFACAVEWQLKMIISFTSVSRIFGRNQE